MRADNASPSVAAFNLDGAAYDTVRAAVDHVNARLSPARRWRLRRKNDARDADLLIARLNVPDPARTAVLLRRLYACDRIAFVTEAPAPLPVDGVTWLRAGRLHDDLAALLERLAPEPESEPAAATPPAVGETAAAAAVHGRVLVVDDSPSVRAQMSEYLQRRRFACTTAENAEEALHRLREARFDLVFLDVIMPGADGYQVCKAIKALDIGARTPVILLTSKDSPIDKIHGIMSGCDRYLIKPVRASELDRLLHDYFPAFRPPPARTAAGSQGGVSSCL